MTRPTRAHSLSCPRSEVILASCSPPAHVHSRPCIAPRAALWTYLSLGHNLRARPLAHGCPDVLPTRFPARRRMGWLERDGGVFVGVDGEQLPGGAIDGLARRPRRPRRQPGRAGESLRAPPLPTWSTPGIFKYFVTSACVIGAIGVAFAPSSKVRVDGVPCARARLTAPSPIWPPHAHPVRCFLRSQVTLEKGTSLTMDFKRPNCSWRREYMDLNPLGCFRLSLAFEEACPAWLCGGGSAPLADPTTRECRGPCARAFATAAGLDGFVDSSELATLEKALAEQARTDVACTWPARDDGKCWRVASKAGQRDLTAVDACAYARCRALGSATAVKCFAVVCE